MVLASLDHLQVVGPGELGVLLGGGVGGADQRGAQQRGAAFDMGWPLRSMSPVSEALGTRPVKDRNWLPRWKRAGWPMAATRAAALALDGVGGELGLDGSQQPDLGGDLGGEVGERDRRMVGVELDRCLGGGQPCGGPLRA